MKAMTIPLTNPGDLSKALEIIATSKSADDAEVALRAVGLTPDLQEESPAESLSALLDLLSTQSVRRREKPWTGRRDGDDALIEANIPGFGGDSVRIAYRPGDGLCVKVGEDIHFDVPVDGLPPFGADAIAATTRRGVLNIRIRGVFAEVTIPVTDGDAAIPVDRAE